MSEPITKPRVSAAAKTALVLAAAAVLLAVFAQAAPGSKFFFPLVSLWCNLALFACVLLVLRVAGIKFDLFHKAVLVGLWAAALVYFFWALGRRSFVYILGLRQLYQQTSYWAEACLSRKARRRAYQFIFGSFAEDYTNFITLFSGVSLLPERPHRSTALPFVRCSASCPCCWCCWQGLPSRWGRCCG